MSDEEPAPKPLRVFISYSHESEEHRARVLALAQQLRADGVDAWIDRFVPPPAEGWSRWMDAELRAADRVIIVCSPRYFESAEGSAPDGEGLGGSWEWHRIRGEFYSTRGQGARFVPVWFDDSGRKSVPSEAWDRCRHDVKRLDGSGYFSLLDDLFGRPEVAATTVAISPMRRPVVASAEILSGGSREVMRVESPAAPDTRKQRRDRPRSKVGPSRDRRGGIDWRAHLLTDCDITRARFSLVDFILADDRTEVRFFPVGTKILSAGSYQEPALFFIGAGRIEVEVVGGLSRQFKPGHHFGELELFGREDSMLATVRSVSDVIALRVPRPVIQGARSGSEAVRADLSHVVWDVCHRVTRHLREKEAWVELAVSCMNPDQSTSFRRKVESRGSWHVVERSPLNDELDAAASSDEMSLRSSRTFHG